MKAVMAEKVELLPLVFVLPVKSRALLGVLDLGRFRGVGGTDPKSVLPPYRLYDGESTLTFMVR